MRIIVRSLLLAAVMMMSASQPVAAQGVKKDKWIEAIYPGGGWLLPFVEGKVIQIRLHVNRYDIPTTVPDHFYGWGDIELSDVDWDVEGQLGAPTQKGDVFYFGITSESGRSTIGIRKLRDNPDDAPYLKIVDVSGAFAKWVKKGSKLMISQGNGRLYDPTVHAMTEAELDDALKRCNNDNFIDYNWWVKNRKGANASSKPIVAKDSKQLSFMGIPVNQRKANLESQLKSKGFRSGKDLTGSDCLSGKSDGIAVNIFVNDKCLTVTDNKLYSYANAKKRYASLITKMTSEYGRGKNTSDGEDIKDYEIDGPGGQIRVSMWDSDEANYNSGQYLVAVVYDANYATSTPSVSTESRRREPATSAPSKGTVTLEGLLKASGLK